MLNGPRHPVLTGGVRDIPTRENTARQAWSDARRSKLPRRFTTSPWNCKEFVTRA